MKHIERGKQRLAKLGLGAAVLMGAALGPVVIGVPAAVAQSTSQTSSSQPNPYAAGASGTALVLSLAGNSLTAGVSGAEATSAPEAKAEADGVLTPALTAAKQALVRSLSGSQTGPSSCATPAIPSLRAPCTPAPSHGLLCSRPRWRTSCHPRDNYLPKRLRPHHRGPGTTSRLASRSSELDRAEPWISGKGHLGHTLERARAL